MNRIKNMSLEKKLISGILLLFLVVIGSAIIFNFTFSSGDIKTNYKDETVEVDNLKISEITISETGGISTYSATLTALIDKKVNYIEITLKDDYDQEIVTLIGYVGVNMKQNEKRKIEAGTDADLTNVTTINYKVIS